LIERTITITGAVNNPKNLLVRIGTSYKELIDQCGGPKGNIKKIISGGPMMGIAQSTDEIPVIKGTSGILLQSKEETNLGEAKDCIRCARCVDVCPIELLPTQIARYAEHDMIKESEQFFPMDCFECGCCSYVCPSKIPLVHWIKYAKNEITKQKKK
jgi:electron transport complex protein RnfC